MSVGIEESTQASAAAVIVIKEIIKLSKDGLDWSDAFALGTKFIANEKFRSAVVEGIKDGDKIIEELKDISASEALALVDHIVKELKASE